MPREVKNVIGSHLDKKSLGNLKQTSKTMNRTVTPLPAARAATTIKTVAQPRVQENKGLTRGWKAMMTPVQAAATANPNPATRFNAARQALGDSVEHEQTVHELKRETRALQGAIQKADIQKKKNM